MKPFVYDTAPLIYLGKAKILETLRHLTHNHIIPTLVYGEVMKKPLGEETHYLKELLKRKFFEIQTGPTNKIEDYPTLSETDVQTIHLSRKIKGVMISDDETCRLAAQVEGIEVHGSIYLIFSLVKKTILKKSEAKKIIENMIRWGWFCSTDLYTDILEELDTF